MTNSEDPSTIRSAVPRRRLLVAEDDQALREMIISLLKVDGYEVIGVADGFDLLEAVETSLRPDLGAQQLDLVISDVRMPGMTGLRAFGQLGYGPTIPPVIFITAFGSDDVHREAIQLGAVAVLDKPVDLDELRGLVKSFFATRFN